MMEINLSPKIELSLDESVVSAQRMKVFSSTLSGIFHLTARIAGADTIKVYGRTDSFLLFLKVFHNAFHDALGILSLNNPGLEIAIEGQWLVFRHNSGATRRRQ